MQGEQSTDAQRARLTVTHRQEDSGVPTRGIHVSLDGREFAFLKANDSYTREIRAGHRRLRANNTFLPKTVEFDIRPGEHVQYETYNAGFGTWMVTVLGAGPLYLVLRRVTG